MATFYKAPTTNFWSTTLNGSISDSVTTITLNSVTGLQAPGVLILDREDGQETATPNSREVISFTGIAGNDITGCTRGFDGSTARSHTNGALAESVPSVGLWNDLRNAVAASLTTDGTGIAISGTASIATLNISDITKFATTSIASIARAQIATGIITNGIVSNMTISNSLNASGASIVGVYPSAASGAVLVSRGNDTTPTFADYVSYRTTGPQTSFATTSVPYVDIPGATITITPPNAARVFAMVTGQWSNSSSGQNTQTKLMIDGVTVQEYGQREFTATHEKSFALSGLASVAAGSRVIKVQGRVDGGTGTFNQTNLSVIYG
jgi:hypothetical protein